MKCYNKIRNSYSDNINLKLLAMTYGTPQQVSFLVLNNTPIHPSNALATTLNILATTESQYQHTL